MKMKIEGIEIVYKNVSDLNAKVGERLALVRKRREKQENEVKGLRRTERSFMKFLGIQYEPSQSVLDGDSKMKKGGS